jgi:thiol-disulfide isomerase/thioredoxin
MTLRLLRARTTVALLMMSAMPYVSAPPAALADMPLSDNNNRLRFYGTELSGALFDGRSLIGKPAVLWFYTPAPSCGLCFEEAANISQVAAAHPEVSFVGIGGRWDVMSMRRLVDTYGLRFPNLNDANGMLWQAFYVPWPPAWAFLRPDGTGSLVNDITTAMSEQELTDRINALTAP